MTKTAGQMLTEDEVRAMIDACQTSRDRAIIATLYEGGFRVQELGTLTWAQVKFDDYGTVVNVDEKTGAPRYIRLVTATQYLIQWKNDFPFPVTPGCPGLCLQPAPAGHVCRRRHAAQEDRPPGRYPEKNHSALVQTLLGSRR